MLQMRRQAQKGDSESQPWVLSSGLKALASRVTSEVLFAW